MSIVFSLFCCALFCFSSSVLIFAIKMLILGTTDYIMIDIFKISRQNISLWCKKVKISLLRISLSQKFTPIGQRKREREGEREGEREREREREREEREKHKSLQKSNLF